MSRSGSQQSQGLQPPPTVAVAAAGAPAAAAAGTKATAAPLPVHPTSRFSVFGKNLTNATAPGPEVRAGLCEVKGLNLQDGRGYQFANLMEIPSAHTSQGGSSFLGRTATTSLHKAASANAASKSFVFSAADSSNSMYAGAGGGENSRDAAAALATGVVAAGGGRNGPLLYEV